MEFAFFICRKEGKDKRCVIAQLSVIMFKEKLIVKRVINNNIVIAENYKGQEMIAIGKGLGFRKSQYDVIFPNEVAKTYMLLNHSGYLFRTLEEIPYEIIELTQKIIDEAQKDLKNTYNVNLVVALADHINFSVSQFKAGVAIPVLVNEEVRRFYKEEYAVGKKAIEMINQTLHVQLAKEEAASIAFHLIAATEKRENHDSLKIMQGVGKIIEIVEKELKMSLNEESLAYTRFIIHLKFFMRGILFEKKTSSDHLPDIIYSNLKKENKKASRCVEKISMYVSNTYDYQVTEDDCLYLLVHIIRVMEQKNSEESKGEYYGKD